MKNDTIHLAGVYTRTVMKSWFQYSVDAVLRSLAVFIREAVGIIVIYFSMLKFDTLNGWNIHELMFLFSLLFLTYGILIIFFTGLRDYGKTVRSGGFDRIVLRPRGLLFQLIFSDADWFAAIGHGGLGIVLFVISAGKVGISWSVGTVFIAQGRHGRIPFDLYVPYSCRRNPSVSGSLRVLAVQHPIL